MNYDKIQTWAKTNTETNFQMNYDEIQTLAKTNTETNF